MSRSGWAAVVAAAALAVAPGCGFAVRHPAITVGLVTGGLALGTCELATEEHAACFAAGGGAAAFLGLIAAAALWLGDTGEPSVLHAPWPEPPPEPPAPAPAPPPEPAPVPTSQP